MSDEVQTTGAVPAPATAQAQSRLMRIGGHLIDVGDWPDEVIEKIRKDYLLPPATERLFIARVTLSAVCPARHSSQHNVGLMAESAEMARAMADGMPKARIGVNCPECGRQATVTGKHVYFAAPMSQWDGAL